MISSLLHLVGLRPRVYYTLTNFRGGGKAPLAPPLNTPMGVPAIVFKECAEALSEPLTILFNSFFDCHYIPDILKRAAIVPVYKSGEKSNPINYRPISLTPILMKILERIVRKQVVQFLTDNNFLNSTQHGFREGRSCLAALLNVYDDIVHMISDPSAVVDMI